MAEVDEGKEGEEEEEGVAANICLVVEKVLGSGDMGLAALEGARGLGLTKPTRSAAMLQAMEGQEGLAMQAR